MKTKYTLNSVWTTIDGREITFKELEDTHIANIIHYLENTDSIDTELYAFIRKIAKSRKLSFQFLEQAPYPYRDDEGRFKIWTPEDGFHYLEPEVKFINKLTIFIAGIVLGLSIALIIVTHNL